MSSSVVVLVGVVIVGVLGISDNEGERGEVDGTVVGKVELEESID